MSYAPKSMDSPHGRQSSTPILRANRPRAAGNGNCGNCGSGGCGSGGVGRSPSIGGGIDDSRARRLRGGMVVR